MSAKETLSALRTQVLAAEATAPEKTEILVGMATCAIAAGADETFNVLQDLLRVEGLLESVVLRQVGCVGRCSPEPLVEVRKPGEKPRLYVKVDAERARLIVTRDLQGNAPLADWTLEAQPAGADALLGKDCPPGGDLINRFVDDYALVPFFGNQLRIALRNVGRIDPDSLSDYLSVHGYEALAKVFDEMTPEQVVAEVTASGLRGRGGAGFPTGMKWKFTAEAAETPKYVVCNADEGDPGAFMDRSTLEGDPHAVLEAMIIAGYAVGAHQGYIYIRAEYPLAVKRLRLALADAYANGLLGQNILGSGFDFDLELRLGAGAFVCGEETALLASIEGKRGMPRPRPPFPATSGLWGKPTLINNVETYANIAPIILLGSAWFSAIGTEKSKGTKVFALAGNVNNTGLIEVPMGTTLREIVYSIGGGIPGGKAFKAAQTGGPSGGMLPEAYLDTPVDYESLKAAGTIMGSGGLIVMDDGNCMVDMAKFFLTFTQDESCGKCTPCREGTLRMLEILERITTGRGVPEDVDKLRRLGQVCQRASLCGLGQGAPSPVLSTLRHFAEEYTAHIEECRCPAGQCKALVLYKILEESCVGCGLWDGKWRVELEPLAAGGPLDLKAVSGAESIDLKNVLCGDVYLCSGQSNMQLPVKDCANADEEIAKAKDYPGIRLLLIPKSAANTPADTFAAKWQVCAPKSAAGLFGRGLLLRARASGCSRAQEGPRRPHRQFIRRHRRGGLGQQPHARRQVRAGRPSRLDVRLQTLHHVQRHDRAARALPDQGRALVPGRVQQPALGTLRPDPLHDDRRLAREVERRAASVPSSSNCPTTPRDSPTAISRGCARPSKRWPEACPESEWPSPSTRATASTSIPRPSAKSPAGLRFSPAR